MKNGTINPMELYQNKILSAKAGLYFISGTVSHLDIEIVKALATL
jgi:hypothetical protein